jgi:hypothetical protein
MNLKTLALLSGIYDLLLAAPMLLAPVATARLFGAPPPVPVLNAELNGVFTLTLAAGYFWAAQDVESRRGYLWVAGVLAKGLGAALFVADHFARASPASFLLFAATDGALALLTLLFLLRGR